MLRAGLFERSSRLFIKKLQNASVYRFVGGWWWASSGSSVQRTAHAWKPKPDARYPEQGTGTSGYLLIFELHLTSGTNICRRWP